VRLCSIMIGWDMGFESRFSYSCAYCFVSQVLSSAMLHHEDEEVDVAYKLSLVSMYRYILVG